MGGGLPPVSNYKIYKVENVPELQKVQERLGAHGLKDPWLRNEVWRYHPGFGTYWSRFRFFWFRGMLPGIILGYGTYLANQWYLKQNPDFYHWHDPDFPEKAHEDHGHGHH